MLNDLSAIHQNVIATIPLDCRRYLYEKIHWDSQSICLLGGRGVGKTTLMCQYLIEKYKNVSEALYISADNSHVLYHGLFSIAQEYFKYGGKALFIDEVHKYPDWEREIKNICDTFRKHQLIFSGSSSLDLRKSKYDLSRRAVYYDLKGLSFREYLLFSENIHVPVYTLEQLLSQHTEIADQFKGVPILKYFLDYLSYGYFPFFLEGKETYLSKISNVIEQTIFEDIAVVFNLRQGTLPVLKKILWLVATSNGLLPNIDRISKNLGVSREVIYQSLEYLDKAGLLNNILPHAKGMKLIRKPGKIYLENTNFLYAMLADLKLDDHAGGLRETFFANQLSNGYSIKLHDQGDFIIEGKTVIEVGGKSKDFRQIHSLKEAYLAIDNIEIGFGKKIPLYVFGFLY